MPLRIEDDHVFELAQLLCTELIAAQRVVGRINDDGRARVKLRHILQCQTENNHKIIFKKAVDQREFRIHTK